MIKKSSSVEQLIDDLTKPLYVYRMARGMSHGSEAQARSAITRMANAEKEIIRIVREWVKNNAG